MPERVEAWWARRQWSKATPVPYSVGEFRDDWEAWPVLIRQYHPDLNAGIVLTQVPPAADVWLLWQCDVGHAFVATPSEQRAKPGRSRRHSTWCPDCTAGSGASTRRPAIRMCLKSDAATIPIGDAFRSACAPTPASAAEPALRQKLRARLEFDDSHNAIRVKQAFFTHLEVWPDIILADLKVAIEYDTTGRDGLEHVGKREASDRRKDRLLRHAGWEVIRIRTGKLRPIGPYDLRAAGPNAKLVARILERLREIRGDLIVDCYLTPPTRV